MPGEHGILPVDNSAVDVDAETYGSFFAAQAVDGVIAGHMGSGCLSFG
jgi:hypothetical protein